MSYKSEVVAEEVRVLAIGGNLSGTRSDLRFFTGQDGSRDQGSIVLLEVTVEQALQLLEKSGGSASSLSLLLRSPSPERGSTR
jgi:Flp pilus assembly protein CpaB